MEGQRAGIPGSMKRSGIEFAHLITLCFGLFLDLLNANYMYLSIW